MLVAMSKGDGSGCVELVSLDVMPLAVEGTLEVLDNCVWSERGRLEGTVGRFTEMATVVESSDERSVLVIVDVSFAVAL